MSAPPSSRDTSAPEQQTRGHTLLVGGSPRPGTDFAPLPSIAGQNEEGPPEYRYQEVILATPLVELPDAWATLRQIWPWAAPGGILTAVTGRGLCSGDALDLLALAGFETVWTDKLDGSTRLRARAVARSAGQLSCTVVVPCRNEVDNVDAVVQRIPALGTRTEILFVDGASTDGTADRVRALIDRHRDREIVLLEEDGTGGKAAAVFEGFSAATGEVLMILDADMTVAPEDLPRFFLALAEDRAEFANGNRFAFPREAGAMPPANAAGNRAFAAVLSPVLGTNVRDTLCGTKALFKSDWDRIAGTVPLFGGHDPWGDFDLLLAAAYAGLRIREVPVVYHARTAGESKMRPLRHGLALLATCIAGARHLRFSRAGRQRRP